MAGRELAVKVSNAYKYYGTEGKPDYKSVLSNFSMSVERGTIYGLLGPSGCGKTTLLSSIVGRRQFNSGEVWVLGGRPGEKGSGVPGPRVGYMPQDIALVAEFTVRDAVYYFGRIYGMEMKKLAERFEFLTKLLELPEANRLIKSMSGGQQRRVSLAAALVHEPELLILDEPTVGLDPVLRERIWDFLTEVTRGGSSVIITTHYIDETRQAHKIGLLRDGQLLAEESPTDLMRKMECETLEEAFLQLAMRHQELPRTTLTASPDVIPDGAVSPAGSRFSSREDFSVVTSSTDVLTTRDNTIDVKRLRKSRYKAVLIKNLQQFSRHPGGLVFSVLFPIIQVVAFFSAIGHNPRDLKLAVVNDETAFSPLGYDICSNSSLQPIIHNDDGTCTSYMLSCWFLDELENNQKLKPKRYATVDEAKDQVRRGNMYGAMYIPGNFSIALEDRFREGNVDNETLDDSTISVWLDMTDNQISHFLKHKLSLTYNMFSQRIMKACGRPERLGEVAVHFQEPVYGKTNAQFSSFMAPGVMVTILYFLAAVVTSTLMISDRLEGVWERSAVAGVKPKEMLQVHILIQSSVIFVQTIELMVVAYACYGLANNGSLLACGSLLFLQGLSGMVYGFLLSVCCSSYTVSFFIATGSFYPMILLCGIALPLEGMAEGLVPLALALPFTVPGQALRDIMEKGYTISNTSVWSGYLITIAWIFLTLALCFLRLKYKKS